MKKHKRRRTIKEAPFFSTLRETIRAVQAACKRHMNWIVAVALTVCVALSYKYIDDISIPHMICFVSYGVFFFFNQVRMKVNTTSQNGLPIPYKRFTKVEDDGMILLSNDDEAIVYLYELENWMEKKGYLKITKTETININ